MKRHYFSKTCLALVLLLLGACGTSVSTVPTSIPTPIPPTATLTSIPPSPTHTYTPVPTSTKTPTATSTKRPAATATSTPRATATRRPLPATPTPIPTITNVDRATYGLLSICERVFIIQFGDAIVPNLADCYKELFLAEDLNLVVAPEGDLAPIVSNSDNVLFGVSFNVEFVIFPAENFIVDPADGEKYDEGQLSVYYDANSPNEWFVLLNSPWLGQWSGFIDLTKGPFDLNRPINEQAQTPLQEGNQFE